MSCDNRQAFKYGFLKRCAEEGLTPEAAEKRASLAVAQLTKSAYWGEPIANMGVKLVEALPGLALQSAMLLPAAAVGAGAVGGYGLARMNEKTVDPEEVQKQELIATYNAFADQLKRRRQLRRSAGARPFAISRG